MHQAFCFIFLFQFIRYPLGPLIVVANAVLYNNSADPIFLQQIIYYTNLYFQLYEFQIIVVGILIFSFIEGVIVVPICHKSKERWMYTSLSQK